jgi:hypothetical protein
MSTTTAEKLKSLAAKVSPTALPWLLVVMISTLVYALVLLTPIPRQIGLIFRYEFTSTVFLLLILFSAAYLFEGWTGQLLKILITLLVFAMPLSGLWAGGSSEPSIIGGLLPYSDASNYYNDALRLLSGWDFQSLATRRPLFTVLLSAVLWLTGRNLQLTLAVLVLLTTLGTVLAANRLKLAEGPYAAILFSLLVFLYYRRFIGTTLTEHYGLLSSLLGFTFLLRGLLDNRPRLVLSAILMVSFALNARAGTMFLLPALVVWTGFEFRAEKPFSWKWSFWAALAALSGFAANYFLFRLLSSSNTALFSNFSYTLYGLARGGLSWTAIFNEHPELVNLLPAKQSARIYQLALDLILTRPGLLVQGALKAWTAFFDFRSAMSLFGFVGGGDVYFYAMKSGASAGLYVLGRAFIMLLGLVGIVRIAIYRKRQRIFVLAVWSGILLSVPFVPPWDADRMRAYAATIPLMLYFPAVGLAWIAQLFKIPALRKTPSVALQLRVEGWFAGGLIAISLLFPALVLGFRQPLHFPAPVCPSGNAHILVGISSGSYLSVEPDASNGKTWLPRISQNRYISSMHDLPDYDVTQFLEGISVPKIVTYSVDLRTGSGYWLLIDPSQLSQPIPGQYAICGELLAAPGALRPALNVMEVEKINTNN